MKDYLKIFLLFLNENIGYEGLFKKKFIEICPSESRTGQRL